MVVGMWAKLAAIYNRAKSANAAFSLADRAWQVFLLVTGLSGAGVLAWMSTTWNWYWATFSWAGVAIAFLICWVALTGGFFLSGLAVSAWRDGKSNARTGGNNLEFVKNIVINANSPDAPALFSGTASDTFDKITLFLDYSAHITGFGIIAWSERRRIKLDSFDPFEKGIRYEAAIFSRTLDADGKTVVLNWGNNTGNTEIITSDKYRARLAFTVSGNEQYFYFILVAPYLPNGQRIATILNQDDFTFRQEWEEA
jgi:hypothetical protein